MAPAPQPSTSDPATISEQPASTDGSVPQHTQLNIVTTPQSSLVFAALCPCSALCSWFTVAEGVRTIVMNTGVIVGEASEPGCHFYTCFCRETRSVSTKLQTITLERSKLADKDGNPVLVSAMLVFRVTSPLDALLQVTDLRASVSSRALAVFRQTITKFPYVSSNGEPCLTHDAAVVNAELRTALQPTLSGIGVTVVSFSVDELSFAPEVASSMLQRQAAQALISARSYITESVVEITTAALQQLQQRGVTLRPAQRFKLVSSLMTVLSSVDENKNS